MTIVSWIKDPTTKYFLEQTKDGNGTIYGVLDGEGIRIVAPLYELSPFQEPVSFKEGEAVLFGGKQYKVEYIAESPYTRLPLVIVDGENNREYFTRDGRLRPDHTKVLLEKL